MVQRRQHTDRVKNLLLKKQSVASGEKPSNIYGNAA